MAVFKKTIRYSKSSKNLEEKIKDLDESLKKTGVLHQEGTIVYSDDTKSQVEIYEESGPPSEDELYDWRRSFICEDSDLNLDDQVKESNRLNLVRVEKYITDNNRELIEIRDQIFKEITEDTLLNLPEIKNKISRVLEIYDEIKEGLLNEPPEVKNEDPLTPLNQNFVTIEELNKHYTLFINRIQEQIATIGGGGETQLKYLDDVVGIATNPSAYDGKFIKYNHSLGKFEFDTIYDPDFFFWTESSDPEVGIHTLTITGDTFITGGSTLLGITFFDDSVYMKTDNELVFGHDSTSPTGLVIGFTTELGSRIMNFSNLGGDDRRITLESLYDGDIIIKGQSADRAVFTGFGATITGTIDTNNVNVSGIVTASVLNVGTGGTIISTTSGGLVGIGTTNPTSALTIMGGDVSVGIDTSQGLILTSPNGTKYRLVVDDGGSLSTVLVV